MKVLLIGGIRAELGFSERMSRVEAVRCAVEWEAAHPPATFTPHTFDYDAEDAALAAWQSHQG